MRNALASGLLLLATLAGPTPSYAEEEAEAPDNLFEFAAGPDQDGELGASLRADLIDAPRWLSWGQDYHGFYGLKADSKWQSTEGALNQSTVAAQLGVFAYKDWPMFWGAEPALELQAEFLQRVGKFKQSDADQVQEANQTLIGLTGSMQLPWGHILANKLEGMSGTFPKIPTISVSHYWLQDDSVSDVPLPGELAANNLIFSLTGDLPLARIATGKKLQTLRLLIHADATKPTTGTERSWQEYVELKLVLDTGTQLRPVLAYTNGERNGLNYDRQAIVGLLWSLDGGSAVEALATDEAAPVQIISPAAENPEHAVPPGGGQQLDAVSPPEATPAPLAPAASPAASPPAPG